MQGKEKLLSLLYESGDGYASGNWIAKELGMTRAAVWKMIRQLEAEGYEIDAVTNRGYRLGRTNDMVNVPCLCRYLAEEAEVFCPEAFEVIDSTNTYLKARAAELPAWHAVVAGEQTAGRGRSGRSFYSPSGSGVYLSVLRKPRVPAEEASRITTAAAVAACRAIEECTDEKPSIKWVNDIFVRGRKVCGILTEASVDLESGSLDWAVMGIGFNVYEPEEGFPEEIREVAGGITKGKQKDLRCRLAAAFLRHFRALSQDLSANAFAEEYRERSFLIGRDVAVLSAAGSRPARVLDVDPECRLIVRYEDGHEEALSSGEVRVRPVPDGE
ncbi:MAG: biotin--[Lachnospiraceae bacterium]|nr:biotin--[acetyl-CoA-carboxylase] ligase [Lachnospiraceae bacterium]